VHRGEVSWILEADIKSFFDSVDRKALREMLQIRVADGSLMRLIGKCLHVGGCCQLERRLGRVGR
jgi:retron-type reverse transcriptase